MKRPKMITLAALLWIGMIAALLFSDITSQPVAAQSPQGEQTAVAQRAAQAELTAEPVTPPVVEPTPVVEELNPADSSGSPDVVVAPYTEYTISQGPHGFSYGHTAIDMVAGQGATILSPINGSVVQNFIDYLGNTTLVIENDHYQVTLMHGNYSVRVGEVLAAGQPVGTESNNGNTVDWWGRSCAGRDCGYHTHLNIFDKFTGSNVNPLTLIP